jgi:hypothetical protein
LSIFAIEMPTSFLVLGSVTEPNHQRKTGLIGPNLETVPKPL